MRLVLAFFLLFCAQFAMAADTIYVSSLTTGNPLSLDVAKFTRPGTGALSLVGSISKVLTVPAGVTSIQPNGDTQIHIYRTERPGSKVRIVRETVDLNTFTFVAGSTKNYPANLFNLINFDSNDALALVHRQNGTRLHTRPMNASGDVIGGFRVVPPFPFNPFGAHISDGRPFFVSSLWTQTSTGKTGITFTNTVAPFKAQSFLFTNRIAAQDVSSTFPREGLSSAARPIPGEFFLFVFVEVLPNANPQLIRLVQKARGFLRFLSDDSRIQKADFTPAGNIIQIGAPRIHRNTGTVLFNGIGVDPLGIAIVYDRFNIARNTNEIILQTFNPLTLRKVGPPKVAKAAATGFARYGISVFNPKFSNGTATPGGVGGF